MDELARTLADARSAIEPVWSEARSSHLQRRIASSRRRRQVALIAACVCAMAFGAVFANRALQPHRQQLELADGSTIIADTLDADIAIESERVGEVVIALRRGRARFDVAPSPSRLFRVRVQDVVIEVLGTAFDVDMTTGPVIVTVRRGRVAVHGPDGDRVLAAGERGAFAAIRPTAVPPPAPVVAPAPEPTPEPTQAPPTVAEPEPGAPTAETILRGTDPSHQPSRWRSLARQGRYDEAYARLRRDGDVRDVAQELSDAADASRMSGHARESVPYLRTIIKRHPDDPLAPLAAFTLGRVLLEQLGEPRQAAAAFQDAQRLKPGGSLMEDALAREVEAWAKAGDTTKAHERAQAYVATYPRGTRVKAVRGFGGLE